jgi:protein gp37
MGEYTKIAWTDSTWNPWIGCSHAGPGCDHCYAEAQNKFRGWNGGTWGNNAPRQVTSEKNWKDPVSWNSKALAGRCGKDGKRWLVFAGDLCDIFDHLGDKDARARMWELFRQTPYLTWMILTKRPQHIPKFLPADWGNGYHNVWLGTSVENRKNGYPRIDALRCVPATLRFLSCEPLLEDICDVDLTGINWAIVGGESGAQARPFDLDWARAIKRQCKKFSARFYFKQLGYRPQQNGVAFPLSQRKQSGSKDTHGVLMENFPIDLRVQKWPK